MTCGVACLRMIQEWLGGWAEAETTWAERAGCNERGLTPTRLHRQLKRLVQERGTVREIARTEWTALPDDWRPGKAYIALVDWCYEGERAIANDAHYLIVHQFSRGRRFGGGMIDVAVVQDPGDGPDPQFWSWRALLALETHRIFEIRKEE